MTLLTRRQPPNYLYHPDQSEHMLHRFELRDSGYTISSHWCVILDIRHEITAAQNSYRIKQLLDYMDVAELLSSMIVSPDIYDNILIYDKIHECIGGDLGKNQWIEMTDGVDELYATLINTIEDKIKSKNKGRPYALNKWITPTSILVSSVTKV